MSKPKNFEEMRDLLQDFIHHNRDGQRFWDCLTCLRGPDTPSERPDMNDEARSVAYDARRERKYRTVEIIRARFLRGGAARAHSDDHVTLPPQREWDHFDRHVADAANVLGLRIETLKPKKDEVKCNWVEPPSKVPKGKFPKIDWAEMEAKLAPIEKDESDVLCEECGNYLKEGDLIYECDHGSIYCSNECKEADCPSYEKDEDDDE